MTSSDHNPNGKCPTTFIFFSFSHWLVWYLIIIVSKNNHKIKNCHARSSRSTFSSLSFFYIEKTPINYTQHISLRFTDVNWVFFVAHCITSRSCASLYLWYNLYIYEYLYFRHFLSLQYNIIIRGITYLFGFLLINCIVNWHLIKVNRNSHTIGIRVVVY
jgi:hypothetical protein